MCIRDSKYSSNKVVRNVNCKIYDEEGNLLAFVFERNQIHNGVNKVLYTLEHNLNKGDFVRLEVATTAGKVLSEKMIEIK